LNLQLTLTHQIIQTCMKFKLSIWLLMQFMCCFNPKCAHQFV
jgi:hypothetical protein